MQSWSTARQGIWELVSPLREPAERIQASDSLWRILRQDLLAPVARPAFDCSAMDGFAVRSTDLQGASPQHPIRLPRVGAVYAGHPVDQRVEAGQCMSIATGAKLPAGADTVVRREQAKELEGKVCFFHPVQSAKDLRRRGEEIAQGDCLWRAGARIDAAALARICGMGVKELRVHRRPRVAILSSGDELLGGDDREDKAFQGGAVVPATAQIHDANLPFLRAFCRARGLEAQALRSVDDSKRGIRAQVEGALSCCDVLVSSGGLSAGDKDYMIPVANELGAQWVFSRVAMRPGKPVSLAKIERDEGQIWWLLLPGNPGAVAATAHSFLGLLLDCLEGLRLEAPKRSKAFIPLNPAGFRASSWTRVLPAKLSILGARVRADVNWRLPSSHLPGTSGDGTESGDGLWVAVQGDQPEQAPLGLPLNGLLSRTVPKKVPTLAFVGSSNSGKTTLLCEIVETLKDRFNLWVAKHSHHNARPEAEHKDSARLYRAGAENVLLIRPEDDSGGSEDANRKSMFAENLPGSQIMTWKRSTGVWSPRQLAELAEADDRPPDVLLFEGFSSQVDQCIAVLGPGQSLAELDDIIAQRRRQTQATDKLPKFLAVVFADAEFESPDPQFPCFQRDDVPALAAWLEQRISP